MKRALSDKELANKALDLLREFMHLAYCSVEYGDWPEMQRAVARAEKLMHEATQ